MQAWLQTVTANVIMSSMGISYQLALEAQSLVGHPESGKVQRILRAALEAADPAQAVRRVVTRAGSLLQIDNKLYDLDEIQHIYVLAFGKAAPVMASALASMLPDKVGSGLIVSKYIPSAVLPYPVLECGHPVPDDRSLAAGKTALERLTDLGQDDLLICLISGGGSALLTSPLSDVSLSDLQNLTESLLVCGASINEINTLRRHFDRVKGGGLVEAAAPARTVSLILSDVVGSPLEAIASGPTAPDPTTREDALDILERYRAEIKIPVGICEALRSAPETLKADNPLFAGVQNVIIGSILQSIQASFMQAEKEELNGNVLTSSLEGEARQVGGVLGSILRQIVETGQPTKRPACLIAGGETTVVVRGKGLGGRNLELALGAVEGLAGLENVMLLTMASDGEDGPTDAAGAVVTGESFARARELGLSVRAYLENNDSYHFFGQLGDLLRPGPTGTNVNDLILLFAF
jgi:hydroxypyruvate reductase